MSSYPQIFRLRQKFEAPQVDDLPAEVHAQLATLKLSDRVKPGQTVAVTMGSRGISQIRVIIRAIIDYLKGLELQPFVVPAMGSHGGATAQGQREVLESYGATEEYLGCPIRAGMETVVVCQTAEGFPVHFDRHAHGADHVVVVNRVKPHTRFTGDIESGLMKMMLIGLGKTAGAEVYHRAILDYSFGQIIRSVADKVLDKCNILAGLAIVENAFEKTALIRAVAPEEFQDREKELLVLAKKLLPSLPFDRADLLLIDRIGKNISGTGMDTNVVGRKVDDHKAMEGEFPKIKRIALRGLTPETHGNAVGIGICEFCKSSLIREVDFEKTRLNCLTANQPSGAMVPIHYETDREIIDTALSTIGMVEPADSRVIWITNTLELVEMQCSAAYLDEARSRDNLEVLGELRDLPFDSDGNLPDRTELG